MHITYHARTLLAVRTMEFQVARNSVPASLIPLHQENCINELTPTS